MSIEAYIMLSMAIYFAATWEMIISDKESELQSEEWLTLKHKERLRHLQQRAKLFRKLKYFAAILFLSQVAVDLTRAVLSMVNE